MLAVSFGEVGLLPERPLVRAATGFNTNFGIFRNYAHDDGWVCG
jgi:hypothetical protein